MKKLMSIALALALALSLAACGGSGSQEAPDLQAYYDNFMTSLGDEAPMMMEITTKRTIHTIAMEEVHFKASIVGRLTMGNKMSTVSKR